MPVGQIDIHNIIFKYFNNMIPFLRSNQATYRLEHAVGKIRADRMPDLSKGGSVDVTKEDADKLLKEIQDYIEYVKGLLENNNNTNTSIVPKINFKNPIDITAEFKGGVLNHTATSGNYMDERVYAYQATQDCVINLYYLSDLTAYFVAITNDDQFNIQNFSEILSTVGFNRTLKLYPNIINTFYSGDFYMLNSNIILFSARAQQGESYNKIKAIGRYNHLAKMYYLKKGQWIIIRKNSAEPLESPLMTIPSAFYGDTEPIKLIGYTIENDIIDLPNSISNTKLIEFTKIADKTFTATINANSYISLNLLGSTVIENARYAEFEQVNRNFKFYINDKLLQANNGNNNINAIQYETFVKRGSVIKIIVDDNKIDLNEDTEDEYSCFMPQRWAYEVENLNNFTKVFPDFNNEINLSFEKFNKAVNGISLESYKVILPEDCFLDAFMMNLGNGGFIFAVDGVTLQTNIKRTDISGPIGHLNFQSLLCAGQEISISFLNTDQWVSPQLPIISNTLPNLGIRAFKLTE